MLLNKFTSYRTVLVFGCSGSSRLLGGCSTYKLGSILTNVSLNRDCCRFTGAFLVFFDIELELELGWSGFNSPTCGFDEKTAL